MYYKFGDNTYCFSEEMRKEFSNIYVFYFFQF